ncbi:hypothetical protein Vadar_020496 [Vaccinium darrowii]|uniref:Uncharacterized protein n=1 Tax=Vaccinium darrowii TaxID=229202 RepID=A0ACB7Y1S8_9ERIC|nr:hypothetical protein Vadar_020496 [Vaccinium darrowii]
MFDLHEGNDNDIQVYQTHPANELDEEEELRGEREELREEREQCVVSDTGGYDSDTGSDYRCSGLRDSSSSDESLVEEVNSECVVPHKEPNGKFDFVAEGGTSGNAAEEVGEGTSAKAMKEVGQVPRGKAVEEVGEGTSTKFVEEDATLGDDEEDGNSIDSSDDNESLVYSSNDEKGKKKVKYPEFNEERDMANPKLVEGTIFANVNAFRKLFKEFHIRNGCDYKYIKNESKRVTVKCKEPAEVGCKWRFHASRVGDTTTFQIKIKTITREHTCGRKYQSRWASAEWLAKKFLDKLIDDPDWKVTAMKNDVKRAWMLDVPESHIYRAKRKVEQIVVGDYGEQYFRLWDYCDMIRRENPGSCAKLLVDRPLVDDVPYFQRIFITFDAQAKGFVGNCRPIIHLDACFLKGPYGGQFMHVVGRDANNQMYPLTMAVVESELKRSWSWFLDILTDVIGKPEDKGWVFMESAKNWARCYYSPRAKSNRMVNNISESFNNAMKKVRDKPIQTMLENMRRYIMQRANPKDFVHSYYLTETFKKSYAYLINPIPNRSTWLSSSSVGRGHESGATRGVSDNLSQPTDLGITSDERGKTTVGRLQPIVGRNSLQPNGDGNGGATRVMPVDGTTSTQIGVGRGMARGGGVGLPTYARGRGRGKGLVCSTQTVGGSSGSGIGGGGSGVVIGGSTLMWHGRPIGLRSACVGGSQQQLKAAIVGGSQPGGSQQGFKSATVGGSQPGGSQGFKSATVGGSQVGGSQPGGSQQGWKITKIGDGAKAGRNEEEIPQKSMNTRRFRRRPKTQEKIAVATPETIKGKWTVGIHNAVKPFEVFLHHPKERKEGEGPRGGGGGTPPQARENQGGGYTVDQNELVK